MPAFLFFLCFQIHISSFRENASLDFFTGLKASALWTGWGYMVYSDSQSLRNWILPPEVMSVAAVLKKKKKSTQWRTFQQLTNHNMFSKDQNLPAIICLSCNKSSQTLRDFFQKQNKLRVLTATHSTQLSQTADLLEMFSRLLLLLLLRQSGMPSQVLCCAVNVKAFAKRMRQALTHSLTHSRSLLFAYPTTKAFKSRAEWGTFEKARHAHWKMMLMCSNECGDAFTHSQGALFDSNGTFWQGRG